MQRGLSVPESYVDHAYESSINNYKQADFSGQFGNIILQCINAWMTCDFTPV